MQIKKRIITIVMALALVLTAAAVPAAEIAEAAAPAVDIEKKSIYKAVGYKSHDCVLTANVYMIRRSLIRSGSTKWSDVTNTTLRPYACTSRYGSSLKHDYSYKKDGITFHVVHSSLTGSKSNKISQLKKLLKTHPEGVVVRGICKYGYGHGVLVTEYKNGRFYAVDSTQNIKGANKGILPMSQTTLTNLAKCSDIWYIKGTKGTSITNRIRDVKATEIIHLTKTYKDNYVTLNWSKNCTLRLGGYYVYRKAAGSDSYTKIADIKCRSYTFKNKNNNKTYYYKIRGYKTINNTKYYTKAAYIKVVMKAPEA